MRLGLRPQISIHKYLKLKSIYVFKHFHRAGTRFA